jgi:hypothetical protein
MLDLVRVRSTVRAVVDDQALVSVFAAHVLVDLRR